MTGASRGIGASTVRRPRRRGVDVHAVARSTDPLDALARETGCRPLALDIADRGAVQAAPDAREADVLINNASPLLRSTPGLHLASMPDREEGHRHFYEGSESLRAEAIAEMIAFVVSAPQRMDMGFMNIVTTDQSYGGAQFHRRGAAKRFPAECHDNQQSRRHP